MNKREEFENLLEQYVNGAEEILGGPTEATNLLSTPQHGFTRVINTVPMSEIVKDNQARFDFYRNGNAFYRITVRGIDYNFPVRLSDLDGASLFATEKAMTLMRFMKKAIEDETFVRAS